MGARLYGALSVKGLIQTRGGGKGNAVIRLTMTAFHSLIPLQLVLMRV